VQWGPTAGRVPTVHVRSELDEQRDDVSMTELGGQCERRQTSEPRLHRATDDPSSLTTEPGVQTTGATFLPARETLC